MSALKKPIDKRTALFHGLTMNFVIQKIGKIFVASATVKGQPKLTENGEGKTANEAIKNAAKALYETINVPTKTKKQPVKKTDKKVKAAVKKLIDEKIKPVPPIEPAYKKHGKSVPRMSRTRNGGGSADEIVAIPVEGTKRFYQAWDGWRYPISDLLFFGDESAKKKQESGFYNVLLRDNKTAVSTVGNPFLFQGTQRNEDGVTFAPASTEFEIMERHKDYTGRFNVKCNNRWLLNGIKVGDMICIAVAKNPNKGLFYRVMAVIQLGNHRRLEVYQFNPERSKDTWTI